MDSNPTPTGYKVPRNRKRDYLTTEERERRAERAGAEGDFRAEQAAMQARRCRESVCRDAQLAAVADARRAMSMDATVKVRVALVGFGTVR